MGDTLKIISQDGRTFESIALNSSFIKERLPEVAEGPSCSVDYGWSPIDLNVSGQAVAKPYLIAINLLKRFVDSAQASRGREVLHAAYRTDVDSIRALLASGEISPEVRGRAVVAVSLDRNRGIKIITLLLNKSLPGGGVISDEDRGKAVEIADKMNNKGIICLLHGLPPTLASLADNSFSLSSCFSSCSDLPTTLQIITDYRAAVEPSSDPSLEAITAASLAPEAPDITEYIKAHFHILMAGEGVSTDDLSHVKEFLLCDIHNSAEYSAINSHFINTFSTSEDTVLVEWENAGEMVCPREHLTGANFTTAAAVKGWDIGPISTIISKGYDRDFCERLHRLATLKKKLCVQFQRAAPEEHEGILSRFAEEARNFATYAKKHSKEFKESLKPQSIMETFPARQESMKRIIHIESSLSSGRVFLVAGGSHLHTSYPWLISSSPEFSAEDFMAFAKSRNTVILCARKTTDRELIREVAIAKLFQDILKYECFSAGIGELV